MIKNLFKIENNKSSISSWIINHFPENYESLKYIEPYVGNGSILLNKNPSVEECVSDSDDSVIEIWKMIKDENRVIKSQLSKINYNNKNFDLFLNENLKNDFKKNLYNFLLRLMSKNGKCLEFQKLDKSKSRIFFKKVIEEIEEYKNRIKNIYFLKSDPLEIISKFDSKETFCFCCPPRFDEKKSDINFYTNLTEIAFNFRGKILFLGNNCKFYKRIFSDWSFEDKKNSKDCIWFNF